MVFQIYVIWALNGQADLIHQISICRRQLKNSLALAHRFSLSPHMDFTANGPLRFIENILLHT